MKNFILGIITCYLVIACIQTAFNYKRMFYTWYSAPILAIATPIYQLVGILDTQLAIDLFPARIFWNHRPGKAPTLILKDHDTGIIYPKE